MEGNLKQKITITYEILLVTLAFISVIFIWSENETIRYLDRIIWFFFFIDVVVRLIISKNKWNYIKNNPFDIIAAIPLDSIFQTARVVRLFRVLRLFAISKNYMPIVLSILKTNGLDKIIAFSLIMIFGAGAIVTTIEPSINSFSDGIWWAVVTTTTVGYGDISPTTMLGRLIAIFLMLVGIGLIGMLTGSITTFFINEKKEEIPTIQFIKNQLDRYEQLSPEEMNQLLALMNELKKEKASGD